MASGKILRFKKSWMRTVGEMAMGWKDLSYSLSLKLGVSLEMNFKPEGGEVDSERFKTRMVRGRVAEEECKSEWRRSSWGKPPGRMRRERDLKSAEESEAKGGDALFINKN